MSIALDVLLRLRVAQRSAHSLSPLAVHVAGVRVKQEKKKKKKTAAIEFHTAVVGELTSRSRQPKGSARARLGCISERDESERQAI